MGTKIEIKQEDPLSADEFSHSERQFCSENVGIKASNNVVLLGDAGNMTIKMEIKSEASLPDFGSENEREFLQEDPVRKVEKYNRDNEMDDKIEIKEACWLKVETSYVCDEIKDEGFPPATCPRSCIEAVYDNSGKSPLHSAGEPREDGGLYVEKDNPPHGYSTSSKGQGSFVTENYSVEKDVHLEQSINYTDAQSTYSKTPYLNQQNEVRRSHKCEICEKTFTQLSYLKLHNLIHEGKKPHKCVICEKRFTQLSSLKKHNLIHEGKKPHKCEICEKQFTELSNLKRHYLIHEGKKPHKCAVCEKGFIQLSDLKKHNLIHEGEKPHKCEICGNRFTLLSSLKKHNLIHVDKKPHKCAICEKTFTRLSYLKKHYSTHEGKKPHKCTICEKRFTQLATLKSHNLIHEGEKPHRCEICKKRFTLLSYLKRHYLTHADEKPHKCAICDKKFTHLSSLKTHNLTHEVKNVIQVQN